MQKLRNLFQKLNVRARAGIYYSDSFLVPQRETLYKIITCALLCTSHNFKSQLLRLANRDRLDIRQKRTIIPVKCGAKKVSPTTAPAYCLGRLLPQLKGRGWESREAKATRVHSAENWCGECCTKGEFPNLPKVPWLYSAECVHMRKLLQAEESPKRIWQDSTQSSHRAWDIACSLLPDWKTS